MTTVELLAAVLGGGTLSAVVGGIGTELASRRSKRVEDKKADASVVVAAIEADGKTEASLADVMASILSDMRTERTTLVAAAAAEEARLAAAVEAEAAKRAEALRLVSQMAGRIDLLEPRLQRVEAELDDCHRERASDRAKLDAFERRVTTELARRPPSNPAFPKVGG